MDESFGTEPQVVQGWMGDVAWHGSPACTVTGGPRGTNPA